MDERGRARQGAGGGARERARPEGGGGAGPAEAAELWPLGKVEARAGAKGPKAVLVLTGALSPVHVGHVASLDIARAVLEAEGLAVLGGFLSPSHESYVRPKMARAPERAEEGIKIYHTHLHTFTVILMLFYGEFTYSLPSPICARESPS